LGEAYIHKIKGKETLSRSHNLNATDNNTGLTEKCSTSAELLEAYVEI
jgi:hypothetical protein